MECWGQMPASYLHVTRQAARMNGTVVHRGEESDHGQMLRMCRYERCVLAELRDLFWSVAGLGKLSCAYAGGHATMPVLVLVVCLWVNEQVF